MKKQTLFIAISLLLSNATTVGMEIRKRNNQRPEQTTINHDDEVIKKLNEYKVKNRDEMEDDGCSPANLLLMTVTAGTAYFLDTTFGTRYPL